MKRIINITVLTAVCLLTVPVMAEIKAYWYVLHDIEKKTYKDYYGGIDPVTYQGILPENVFIENIYECVINGNTSAIPEKDVEYLVKEQFRKDTYQVYSKYNPKGNPYVKIAKYDTLVEYCSNFYKLNLNYIKALILKESGIDPDMRGDRGEIGLMQLAPQVVRRIVREQNLPGFSPEQVFEPAWNIAFGCYYLHQLSEQFDDNVDKILAAYHTAPDRVETPDGKPAWDGDTQLYINRVKYLAYIFDSFPQPGDRTRKVVP